MVPIALNLKKRLTREFILDSLVQAINSSGGLRLVDDDIAGEDLPGDEDDGLQVTTADIEIALPKSKDAPYDNNWLPIGDDSTVQAVVFNDYDLLAFKFADDDAFRIEQLEYVE